MARARLRLTPELVARVPPPPPASGRLAPPPGRRVATEQDHAAMARRILAAQPAAGEVWVFAYGSLIWNPEFDFVEERPARVTGWRRSFCLGWDRWFRGSPERPGLMLALDRGGSCHGVAFQLPPRAAEENLVRLMRREVRFIPHAFPARWVGAATQAGPVRAVAFAMDRGSESYVAGVGEEALTEMFATAAGPFGSMAEYLMHTVSGLEARGLRDRQLARLESLAAQRLAAVPTGPEQ